VTPIRTRITALGTPDLRVVDDGREFRFVYGPPGREPVELRWLVADVDLEELAERGAAEARIAWGTSEADGLYFVINRIGELLHARAAEGWADQCRAAPGRIVVRGGGLEVLDG
jgi:hypothetical protein